MMELHEPQKKYHSPCPPPQWGEGTLAIPLFFMEYLNMTRLAQPIEGSGPRARQIEVIPSIQPAQPYNEDVNKQIFIFLFCPSISRLFNCPIPIVT